MPGSPQATVLLVLDTEKSTEAVFGPFGQRAAMKIKEALDTVEKELIVAGLKPITYAGDGRVYASPGSGTLSVAIVRQLLVLQTTPREYGLRASIGWGEVLWDQETIPGPEQEIARLARLNNVCPPYGIVCTEDVMEKIERWAPELRRLFKMMEANLKDLGSTTYYVTRDLKDVQSIHTHEERDLELTVATLLIKVDALGVRLDDTRKDLHSLVRRVEDSGKDMVKAIDRFATQFMTAVSEHTAADRSFQEQWTLEQRRMAELQIRLLEKQGQLEILARSAQDSARSAHSRIGERRRTDDSTLGNLVRIDSRWGVLRITGGAAIFGLIMLIIGMLLHWSAPRLLP